MEYNFDIFFFFFNYFFILTSNENSIKKKRKRIKITSRDTIGVLKRGRSRLRTTIKKLQKKKEKGGHLKQPPTHTRYEEQITLALPLTAQDHQKFGSYVLPNNPHKTKGSFIPNNFKAVPAKMPLQLANKSTT